MRDTLFARSYISRASFSLVSSFLLLWILLLLLLVAIHLSVSTARVYCHLTREILLTHIAHAKVDATQSNGFFWCWERTTSINVHTITSDTLSILFVEYRILSDDDDEDNIDDDVNGILLLVLLLLFLFSACQPATRWWWWWCECVCLCCCW